MQNRICSMGVHIENVSYDSITLRILEYVPLTP
jgi:hypothetical protein